MKTVFSSMKVGEINVPSDALISGFLKWSSHDPIPGYGSLGHTIACAMGEPEHDLGRAADRLIQKLRKENYLTHKGREWFLTEKGKGLQIQLRQDERKT